MRAMNIEIRFPIIFPIISIFSNFIPENYPEEMDFFPHCIYM